MSDESMPDTPPRHWREGAIDRVKHGRWWNQWLLGEDQNADLWVPALRRRDYWRHRFTARNPLHWPSWLLSRSLRQIAMIETEAVR